MSRRSQSPPSKRIKIELSPSYSTDGLEIVPKPDASAAPDPEELDDDTEADHCSICLQPISDRTVIPGCSHEFCFECLLVWTDQSRKCPLCTQAVGDYLIHNIRSTFDYQKHYLTPLRTSPKVPSNVLRATARQRVATRREREWGRRWRQEREEADELERAIEKRKWVYRHNLYAKHVASNAYTRYRPYPTPAQFSASPDLISRATAFIRRELRVWDALDVEFLTTFTLSLMKSLEIRSEPAVRLLAEFLDLDNGGERVYAEHFAHELYCYLRSPYRDLARYDAAVQYDVPPDLPGPLEPSRSRRWRSVSPSPSPSPSRSRDRSVSRHRASSRSRSRSHSRVDRSRPTSSRHSPPPHRVSSPKGKGKGRRNTGGHLPSNQRNVAHPRTDAAVAPASSREQKERSRTKFRADEVFTQNSDKSSLRPRQENVTLTEVSQDMTNDQPRINTDQHNRATGDKNVRLRSHLDDGSWKKLEDRLTTPDNLESMRDNDNALGSYFQSADPAAILSARSSSPVSESISQRYGDNIEPSQHSNGDASTAIVSNTSVRRAVPIRPRNRNLSQSVQAYLSGNAATPDRRNHRRAGVKGTDPSLALMKPENEDLNYARTHQEDDHLIGVPSLLLRLSDTRSETRPSTHHGRAQIPNPTPSPEIEARGSKATTVLPDPKGLSAMRTHAQTQSPHSSAISASLNKHDNSNQGPESKHSFEHDVDGAINGATQHMDGTQPASISNVRPHRHPEVYVNSSAPSILTETPIPAGGPSSGAAGSLRSKLLDRLQQEKRVRDRSQMPSTGLAPGGPAPSDSASSTHVRLDNDHDDALLETRSSAPADVITQREAKLRSQAQLRVKLAAAKRAALERVQPTDRVGSEDGSAHETSLRKVLEQRRHRE